MHRLHCFVEERVLDTHILWAVCLPAAASPILYSKEELKMHHHMWDLNNDGFLYCDVCLYRLLIWVVLSLLPIESVYFGLPIIHSSSPCSTMLHVLWLCESSILHEDGSTRLAHNFGQFSPLFNWGAALCMICFCFREVKILRAKYVKWYIFSPWNRAITLHTK